MSAGMRVQCSIFEGALKGLSECGTRALQGNQLPASPSYEGNSGSYLSPNYGAPLNNYPYSTMYEYVIGQVWQFTVDPMPEYNALKSSIVSYPSWGDIGAAASPARNGWVCAKFIRTFIVGVSLAKNTTGVDQPYFIARVRIGSYISAYPYINAGVSTLYQSVLLDSSGIIHPNEVIGMGQDIEIPFPPDPTENYGNNFIHEDNYYAVIGVDPSKWASDTLGLPFGELYFVTT